MRYLDKGLAILLVINATGHTLGVLRYYHGQPDALFWSLTATVLILLLAAINLLRAARPGDRALAWITTGANGAYAVVVAAFGLYLVHNPFDPRAVVLTLVSLGLMAFSLRTALAR